jgi:hypothetical protein
VKRYDAQKLKPWSDETGEGFCVVEARDYEALLAERDALKGALEQIENANWSSSETATDFAISQAKGLLIGKMKRIAAAALQGAQP